MEETRKEAYERKMLALMEKCKKCTCTAPSPERCEACITGKRIRWLETEYSDITGWSHDKW